MNATELRRQGAKKNLREHTMTIGRVFYLTQLEQRAGRLFAPARQWTEGRVRTQVHRLLRRESRFRLRVRAVAPSRYIRPASRARGRDAHWPRLVAELRRKAVSPSRHGGIVARRA